jgi:glycosyltransferase involved in cell wall biosynthesis
MIPKLAEGGAGRAASRISFLLADEYEFFMILFDASRIDYPFSGTLVDMKLGSKSERFLKKIIRQIMRIRKTSSIKKEYQLDALISFQEAANICNILSYRKCCTTLVSVRGGIHGFRGAGITAAINRIVLKKIYRRADKIITVSEKIRQMMLDEYGLLENKVVSIYNPFDFDEIRTLADRKPTLDISSFIEGQLMVCAVGQLIYPKGFWHLLKAYSAVVKETPNSKLLIFGEGNQEDDIKALINALDLGEHVKLMGFQKNIFPYLRQADLFVMPSLTEGFPNALVEAMICGIPVIAADCITGPREILYNNSDLNSEAIEIEYADYGILVPKMTEGENWNPDTSDQSDKALAEAMNLLLHDNNMRGEFSKKAVEGAKRFGENICKQEYVKNLVDCMDKKDRKLT